MPRETAGCIDLDGTDLRRLFTGEMITVTGTNGVRVNLSLARLGFNVLEQLVDQARLDVQQKSLSRGISEAIARATRG